ncbi:MAG TPA: hypothetical protein VK891_11340 [Euzebyales bacterium]|nr:hypothetical protein [Euzebyales bacterium]
MGRAREWTAALNQWSDAQPQFTGAYSGLCRVHRAQLLQLGGGWHDAAREAKAASTAATQGYGALFIGAAFYQLAELHRLRGQTGAADDAYQRASQYGWGTQPGHALLRFTEGRRAAAVAATRRALAETTDLQRRARLLPPTWRS